METNYWICDVCGERITDPENGWVEWICFSQNDEPKVGRNLRLVHHTAPSSSYPQYCQFNRAVEFKKDRGNVSSIALPELLGPNGLMCLLEKLHENEIPVNEIIEMIKRLHIPGYDIARQFLDDAESNGVYERTNAKGFPDTKQIQVIIGWAEKKKLIS